MKKQITPIERLEWALMLQVNEGLYAKGIITPEMYQLAKNRIVDGDT